ncbi:hypothetical protein [Aeromonas sp. QDB14]|uniref:hypothetical protein n=1 Tax=Aeromonas sp. QDB14 TaxID=2989836 RepID=UPI0022E8D0B0|nr:hypothetical protein [Aeromonas sp. QDB14]
MGETLLALLPSVHASLIGIITAFYLAYFVYGYQKIDEAKDNLNVATNELYKHLFSIQQSDMGVPPSYILNGEHMDWTKMIFHLNETNYTPNSKSHDTYREVSSILYAALSKFPFAESQCESSMPTNELKIKTSMGYFNLKRTYMIQDRIYQMASFLDSHQQKLLDLANATDEIRNGNRELHDKYMAQRKVDSAGIDHSTLCYIPPTKGHYFNNKAIEDYINAVFNIKQYCLDELVRTTNIVVSRIDRYKPKANSIDLLKFSSFIIAWGIMAPMITLTVYDEFTSLENYIPMKIIALFYLAATVTPYIYRSYKLLTLLKGSNHY